MIKRLRQAVLRQEKKDSGQIRLNRLLGKLPIADHRQPRLRVPTYETARPGGRIRGFRTERNYPTEPEIIIKRVHGTAGENQKASQIVRTLQKIVQEHNRRFPFTRYELRSPHAYPLGERFVAMAKTTVPSIGEILGSHKTQRGINFFRYLKRTHGIRKRDLREAVAELCDHLRPLYEPFYPHVLSDTAARRIQNSNVLNSNILVAGVKNKKIIFVPLIDWF
ncbi:MAG: hypothetical protein J4215_03000 [Candidatus Diapherotrites archaeon]|uniref:Uncharacterized protein n=1 Tax=Candidatus Iainarchaeum sp. TaxID=3101447 RepID=A0A8T4LE02_9ARCH|nr:hypothetical protein [Candidatus Diapherotrites archaeon]